MNTRYRLHISVLKKQSEMVLYLRGTYGFPFQKIVLTFCFYLQLLRKLSKGKGTYFLNTLYSFTRFWIYLQEIFRADQQVEILIKVKLFLVDRYGEHERWIEHQELLHSLLHICNGSVIRHAFYSQFGEIQLNIFG